MTEPVTLAELKSHLRITHTRHDTMLTSLIVVARELVERDTWRSLVPISRTIKRRSFPCGDELLYLPSPPFRSLTSISYLDTAGESQTLTGCRTDTLHEPGTIEPAHGLTWPSTRDDPSGVTIVFACGYTDADAVPTPLKQAILLLAAEAYEHDRPVEIKPRTTLDRLLEKYRVRHVGMLENI